MRGAVGLRAAKFHDAARGVSEDSWKLSPMSDGYVVSVGCPATRRLLKWLGHTYRKRQIRIRRNRIPVIADRASRDGIDMHAL